MAATLKNMQCTIGHVLWTRFPGLAILVCALLSISHEIIRAGLFSLMFLTIQLWIHATVNLGRMFALPRRLILWGRQSARGTALTL